MLRLKLNYISKSGPYRRNMAAWILIVIGPGNRWLSDRQQALTRFNVDMSSMKLY